MADFKEYLKSKKIDPEQFEKAERDEFARCEQEFAALGPKAFDLQKKFFLNNWRKQWLHTPPKTEKSASPVASKRPRPVRKRPIQKD